MNEITIRYAYISSPTNIKEDPAYYETLKFKVLTLAELELRPNRINFEELITDGEGVLIKILGRDRSTGLEDMTKEEIFENDIIRWYPNRPKNHIDVLVEYAGNCFGLGAWYEGDYPATEEYSKVVGNIYKNPDWEIEE